MIFVYVLQSERDQKYYIGITNNIENRLKKHNNKGVHSTKSRTPFKLVYSEAVESYNIAREREKEIKSYKSGNSFKKLISQ